MDDALEMLLGRYAGSVGDAPSAIAATFAYALARLEDAGLVHGLDEETTTAAFLGAFAGGYPLCRALTGTAPESPDCAWGQYNKSGFRDAWKTESRRGADFAMFVWTSAAHARLALFQAKKSDIPTEHVRNELATTLHARVRAPALPGIPTVTPAPGTCFVNVHRPAPAAYFEDADLAGVDPAATSPVSQLQALVATARQMEEAAALVHAGYPDAPSWITHLSERPIEVPPEEAPKGPQPSDFGDVARWRKVRESGKQQDRKAKAREQLRSARHATGRQAGPARVDDIDWIHYLAYAQATGTIRPTSRTPPCRNAVHGRFASRCTRLALNLMLPAAAISRRATWTSPARRAIRLPTSCLQPSANLPVIVRLRPNEAAG